MQDGLVYYLDPKSLSRYGSCHRDICVEPEPGIHRNDTGRRPFKKLGADDDHSGWDVRRQCRRKISVTRMSKLSHIEAIV